jgi:hypothetical protein
MPKQGAPRLTIISQRNGGRVHAHEKKIIIELQALLDHSIEKTIILREEADKNKLSRKTHITLSDGREEIVTGVCS